MSYDEIDSLARAQVAVAGLSESLQWKQPRLSDFRVVAAPSEHQVPAASSAASVPSEADAQWKELVANARRDKTRHTVRGDTEAQTLVDLCHASRHASALPRVNKGCTAQWQVERYAKIKNDISRILDEESQQIDFDSTEREPITKWPISSEIQRGSFSVDLDEPHVRKPSVKRRVTPPSAGRVTPPTPSAERVGGPPHRASKEGSVRSPTPPPAVSTPTSPPISPPTRPRFLRPGTGGF
jgi:hypothetical protein